MFLDCELRKLLEGSPEVVKRRDKLLYKLNRIFSLLTGITLTAICRAIITTKNEYCACDIGVGGLVRMVGCKDPQLSVDGYESRTK